MCTVECARAAVQRRNIGSKLEPNNRKSPFLVLALSPLKSQSTEMENLLLAPKLRPRKPTTIYNKFSKRERKRLAVQNLVDGDVEPNLTKFHGWVLLAAAGGLTVTAARKSN